MRFTSLTASIGRRTRIARTRFYRSQRDPGRRVLGNIARNSPGQNDCVHVCVCVYQWASGQTTSSSFVYQRFILSTRSVGAMLWSMAQLRRGQLRMVVDVVGAAVDDIVSCLFWLATLTCCTVRQSPLLHGCFVLIDPSSQCIGVNRLAIVREIPILAYFPHSRIFARTSRISGFILK